MSARVGSLTDWRPLGGPDGFALIDRAERVKGPADVERLRADTGEGVAAAAMEAAAARVTLRRKFPEEIAGRLIADRAGAEMASSVASAAHKVDLLRALCGGGDPHQVLDLCCGIGVDAAAIAGSFKSVLAIDLDPVRSWMCGLNAGVLAAGGTVDCRVADLIEDPPPDGCVFHLDPSRRAQSGSRRRGLGEMSPDIGFIRSLAERGCRGLVKLAPGVDPEDLEVDGDSLGSLEYISEHGRMTQAVLTIGDGTHGSAHPVATMIDPSGMHTLAPAGGINPDGSQRIAERCGRFIYSVDPAVERARLMGRLADDVGGSVLAHPGAGLLTSDESIESPWITGFEVIEELPWSVKRARAVLRALGAGIVEVKTRGRVIEPDDVQRSLRGKGDRPLVVFVQRLGDRLACIVCERVAFKTP